jgi:hypothetical protein
MITRSILQTFKLTTKIARSLPPALSGNVFRRITIPADRVVKTRFETGMKESFKHLVDVVQTHKFFRPSVQFSVI